MSGGWGRVVGPRVLAQEDFPTGLVPTQDVPPWSLPVASAERGVSKRLPVQLCMLYFPSESGQ